MSARLSWPVPSHFAAARVAELFRVPYQQRAQEAREYAARERIGPAAIDAQRIGLLLIDVQCTFCLPDGELFVAGRSGRGAVEDNARLCELIYRNLGSITQAFATLDTHSAAQVFHPLFWVDARGGHPAPYATIRLEDVEGGAWRVNPALARSVGLRDEADCAEYARHYAAALAEGGRFPLTVWPYHAMLGGVGHALVPAIEEALFFHAVARSSPARLSIKGAHPLTEHFSALRPEVTSDHAGREIGGLDRELLDELLAFDRLLIAGQAKSHCVAWTVGDLLAEIGRRDPALAGRVYLLEDCCSPVVVPGVVDCTPSADAAFARFAEAGMQVVRSTDPMEGWPGFCG
jgi:nicotinamidase-related amidase